MAEAIEKRPVGGGFMAKTRRNDDLWQYHLDHPDMTHVELAQEFKISRARVTQILRKYEKARGRLAIKSEGGSSSEPPLH